MIMWAKLQQQYEMKRDAVSEKLFSSVKTENGKINLIAQWVGLCAKNLQKQSLNYLEGVFAVKTIGAQNLNRSGFSELTVQDAAEVLQSLTLCYSSSTPIFFSDSCEKLCSQVLYANMQDIGKDEMLNMVGNLNLSPKPQTEPQSQHRTIWYKNMVNLFLDSFADYLESIGLKRETGIKGKSEYCNNFTMSNSETFQVSSIFLQKDGRKRFLLVQCGIVSFFVTVNIILLRKAVVSSTSSEISEEDYQRIARKTNISSFSYDYHLRYFQEIVFDPELPFNVISVLRYFTATNSLKAPCARNRIISGIYTDQDQNNIEPIISYIAHNGKEYGFSGIYCGIEAIGFGTTTNSLTLKKSRTHSKLDFTLVCSVDKNADLVRVEYFIIIVDVENRFPLQESKENLIESKSFVTDPLMEYIGDGYYISDAVKYFDKKIRIAVQEVSNTKFRLPKTLKETLFGIKFAKEQNQI